MLLSLMVGTQRVGQTKRPHQGNIPTLIALLCYILEASMPWVTGGSRFLRTKANLLDYLGETTAAAAVADAQPNNNQQQRVCKSK